MTKTHSFHIPVMGIGFTIDSPLKVSHLGIDSVISLVDDILLEKLRKMYSEKFKLPYEEITNKIDDFRAKRITSYLDMMQELSENKFNEFKKNSTAKIDDIKEYFNNLHDNSSFKKEFNELMNKEISFNDIKNWFTNKISKGSIDVNIMTKVDKDNFKNGVKLDVEYNDAHAALRGFANSQLESSIILSAGMNPRLYNYIERFEDFYPDEYGYIKKKIVLKVSDYRSALIQGKYFAKKGLWVSEYRIESGLNCGGHAFATDGYLLGPVLEEFKNKKQELHQELHNILVAALERKNKKAPSEILAVKYSAQGGVGTSEEHQFLLDKYNIDSVGWGTPFLLVPEATTVDNETLNQLIEAQEEDLYLSNISPLGVPFNSLRGNTKDVEKEERIAKGKPGSPCPKRFVALDQSYTEKGLCTASYRYQKLKIEELDKEALNPAVYLEKYNSIVEKSCTCVGLGTTALKAHGIETKTEGPGVSVCPGPNMAYFSKKKTLKEMINHIYGKSNIIRRNDRPNLFIKELRMYIDHFKDKLSEQSDVFSKKEEKYLNQFSNNLQEGIKYYKDLFENTMDSFVDKKDCILKELNQSTMLIQNLEFKIKRLQPKEVKVRV
jgi:uncharacterized protein YdhG (YjbR/CyaY superfamily)